MPLEGPKMSISGSRSNGLDNHISSWTPDSAAEKTEEFERAELPQYVSLPPPSPPLRIDCNNTTLGKRKHINHSDTILHSCDSLTAADDLEIDKMMLAQIGHREPLIHETSNDEVGFLTYSRTAFLMSQPNAPLGVWGSPMPEDHAPRQPIVQRNSTTFIHHIKASSKAAKHLQSVSHTEMTNEHCAILNKDWIVYPHQLGYCCSQLLAGTILVDGVNATLLNTIEPYSLDLITDAHYERSLPNLLPYFPEHPTKKHM